MGGQLNQRAVTWSAEAGAMLCTSEEGDRAGGAETEEEAERVECVLEARGRPTRGTGRACGHLEERAWGSQGKQPALSSLAPAQGLVSLSYHL